MKEIKVGITTTFSGVREKLLEWITYHSIIGFDHIWIYINEPWLNGTGLPLEMPGVTFIPYDNKIQNHWKDFKRKGKVRTSTFDTWRGNTQVDALWRAKRMDMDWMAFVDLDEFVVCLNHASVIPNVKEFLKPFQETYGQFSGVLLKSIPFGRNMELPHPGNKMLNYTWRPKSDPEAMTNRNKLIVDVKEVDAVFIHYVKSGKHRCYKCGLGIPLFQPSYKDISVIHYKWAENGVFNTRTGVITATKDLVEDTKFRDDVMDIVLERMKHGLLPNDGMIETLG